jgi:hypothetical protein
LKRIQNIRKRNVSCANTTPSMTQVTVTHEPLVLSPDFPYRLHARQGDAFESYATEILYGGAKFGGKSFLMRFAFIVWCLEAPALQCYLFRKHYRELILNHMEGPTGFREMLAALSNRGICTVLNKTIKFSNGSMIDLNHMQSDKHLQQWQGIDIHCLGIDQLEQFSEHSYRFLRANVRFGKWQPPPKYVGLFPRILCSANPCGVSHRFVKDTFIGKPEEKRAYKIFVGDGMLRQFIPARAEDNPALRADPSYLQRLEGLGNPDLVRALREGDWEVVFGSMFGYVWRDHRHVMPSFPIPVTWEIWRGGDDGYASPASIHWLTRDPDDGTFYVVDEVYGNQLLPEPLARRICGTDFRIALDFGDGTVLPNDLPLEGSLDSAAFSDFGTGKKSRGHQMNEHGTRWKRIEKTGIGDTSFRVMRCQMMHQLLAENPRSKMRDRDGKPMPSLIFFKRCAKAIETIPALAISETNPEDVDTAGDDHAFDSITYGLTHKRRWLAALPVRGL